MGYKLLCFNLPSPKVWACPVAAAELLVLWRNYMATEQTTGTSGHTARSGV